MRDEYDIRNLNPRKNPYASRLKRQGVVVINDRIVGSVEDYLDSVSNVDKPTVKLRGQRAAD